MPEERSYTLHELKLAAISKDEFTDSQVLLIFVNVNIKREEELGEACGILHNYRPQAAERLAKIMKNDYLRERLTGKRHPDPQLQNKITDEQRKEWNKIDWLWGTQAICPVCDNCYCEACHPNGPCIQPENKPPG